MNKPGLLLRLLLVLGLMGWGQFVFSATYNFANSTDAVKACQAAERSGTYPGSWCQVYGQQQQAILVSSIGSIIHAYKWSGCPAGQIPTGAGGQCITPEPDKCESSVGSNVGHQHRLGEFTGRGVVGARIDPPGVVCDGGCQYASTQQPPTSITRFVNGDPSGVFATYTYKGNGVSCTGGDAIRSQPTNGTPTAEKSSECTNKIVHADGSQTYSCSSAEKYTDIGNMNCGQFEAGGEYRCEPKAPSPKMTDKTTDVEVTEKTNPDGSKDTTTTTTTTTTNCSGVNACSTSTTTSSTTSHTKSDGTPGGESTTCTGAACPDSDGKSQEEREQEQEEESESSVSGGQTCEAAPVCEGDAVQCAILNQQYEARCDFEEANDFEENKDAINGLLEGDKFTLQEGQGDIDAPSFISQGTRFLTPSCPPDRVISLSMAGRTVGLSFQPLCTFASSLGPFLVAVTAVICALYVGRSVGGN